MLEILATLIIGILIPFLIFYYRAFFQSKFKLDYILVAYSFGMILKLISHDFFPRHIIQGLIYVSIPLAMPLLIFQADFFSWLKQAPLTVKSFLIACFSTCIIGFLIGNFFIKDETGKKIVAMLVGVYTGGTPNLNAIGLSLKAPLEVIAIANTVDLMASSLYLLFMLFIAKYLITKILPFPFPNSSTIQTPRSTSPEKKVFLILPVLLSIFILLLALGISYGMFQEIKIPFVMLIITVLGILGSMNPTIRNCKMNEVYGNFFITVFCFSTGLILDLTQIFQHFDTLFLASFSMIFFSLMLQVLLSRILKINGEIMMICSIACVMSPAFIPMFVKHFRNDDLLLPGITAGLAGFALGNILGLGIYYLL